MSDPLATAFLIQATACREFGAAFYAGLCEAAATDLAPPVRRLFAPWEAAAPRTLVTDAVALRFLGALNDLVLDGGDQGLAAAYPPATDPAIAWRAVRAAIDAHAPRIEAFMGHEPQTNEVRRSACLLPGFLTIAAETGLPLRCFELGASAGLNQLWPQFRYDYGAAGAWGDPASPLTLNAEWRGAPGPLATTVRVIESQACDRKPIRLADPAQQRRLLAYVWPDQPERVSRIRTAIDMALAAGVEVETAEALDWVRRIAPQAGAATVIFHSVFWQYMPEAVQADARAAVELLGASASADAPLAWLTMEPAGGLAPMELRLRLWPGGEDRRLAVVQAHGAWLDWGA